MKYNQAWKRGYAETVEYAVIAALDAVGEGGQFTLRELADGFNLKVTWNLRRRIRGLVDEGKLACAQHYLNNGRLGYVYSRNVAALTPDAGELTHEEHEELRELLDESRDWPVVDMSDDGGIIPF